MSKHTNYKNVVNMKRYTGPKTEDIRELISVGIQYQYSAVEHKEEVLNGAIETIIRFCKDQNLPSGTIEPGQDFVEYMESSSDDTLEYEEDGLFLMCLECDNGEEYGFRFNIFLGEDDEDDDSLTMQMLILRRKNGYVEIFNCDDETWEIAYKKEMPKELQDEIDNRTQRGRMAMDIYESLAADGEILKDTDEVLAYVKENEPLVKVLDEYSDDLAAVVEGEKVLLVSYSSDMADGSAIGYDNETGEYVLYQYLSEDDADTMDPDYTEEKDSYLLDVDRTKDLEVVLKYIENAMSVTAVNNQSDDDDDYLDEYICIPASWKTIIPVHYRNGVMGELKYILINGGMEKREKDAIRAFKNKFAQILNKYDEEEIDFDFN